MKHILTIAAVQRVTAGTAQQDIAVIATVQDVVAIEAQ